MAKRKPKTQRKANSQQPQTAKRQAKVTQVRAPRGQVGPQTYDQVRKIVDERKIPVGKAFEAVAKATGRTPGTVAVTYYRMAKRKGGTTGKRRGRKAAGRGPGRPRGSAGGAGIKSVLSRVAAAVKELESTIASQAQEIARLRSESGLADRIRKALRD